MHGVAAEHDGDNPEVGLASKTAQFLRGAFGDIIRVMNIVIGLVKVLAMRALILMCGGAGVGVGGVAARGVTFGLGRHNLLVAVGSHAGDGKVGTRRLFGAFLSPAGSSVEFDDVGGEVKSDAGRISDV